MNHNFKPLITFICMICLVMVSITTPGCSKYTVTTTENNPADVAYKKKVLTSLWWGKIDNPQRLADSCGNAGLDEIKISTNIGYSLLHVVTLGFLNKVKVEWKCHQPCTRVGFQP
jgi:hypothetical protein